MGTGELSFSCPFLQHRPAFIFLVPWIRRAQISNSYDFDKLTNDRKRGNVFFSSPYSGLPSLRPKYDGGVIANNLYKRGLGTCVNFLLFLNFFPLELLKEFFFSVYFFELNLIIAEVLYHNMSALRRNCSMHNFFFT